MHNMDETLADKSSSEEKPKAETLADTAIIARYEYVAALQYAKRLMDTGLLGKRMSARNIQRAWFTAVDHGITDSFIKFQTEEEAMLAGIFAKILDLRTIIQANNMAQSKKEKENANTQNTESRSGSENSSSTSGESTSDS